MTPDVSVVIPTRNRLPLLRTTIAAVLGQRDVALEVVVVDEACDDGTTAWLAAHPDPRVRTIRHGRPLGVATSRNDGIEAATAPWVAFLDDDDLWGPDKLRAQVEAAAGGDVGWVASGAVAVDARLKVVETYRPMPASELRAALPVRNPVPAGSSNVLARRSLIGEVGGVDPALRHLADWDLWRRMGAASPLAVVDEPSVAYRLHASNASLGVAGIVEETRVIEERAGHPVDWAAMYAWIGVNELRGGDRRGAAAAFWRSWRAGSRRALLQAANALVTPGAGRRLTFHPLRRDGDVRDVEWRRRADAWLAPMRDASAPG